jgi:hypothetical protein
VGSRWGGARTRTRTHTHTHTVGVPKVRLGDDFEEGEPRPVEVHQRVERVLVVVRLAAVLHPHTHARVTHAHTHPIGGRRRDRRGMDRKERAREGAGGVRRAVPTRRGCACKGSVKEALHLLELDAMERDGTPPRLIEGEDGQVPPGHYRVCEREGVAEESQMATGARACQQNARAAVGAAYACVRCVRACVRCSWRREGVYVYVYVRVFCVIW